MRWGSTIAWDEHQVDRLKVLFADGLSASEIAREMGVDSRSAIIGKLHRLGLRRLQQPRPTKPAAEPRPPRQRRARFAKRMFPDLPVVPLPPRPAPTVSAPTCQPVGLLELTNETCRWPLGEPVSGFCGAREADNRNGVVYCPYHSRIAYRRPGEADA